MNEIAEEAGISRPALYLVFNSKEEIFSAVISRNLELKCRGIEEAIAVIKESRDRRRAALQLWAVDDFDSIHSSPEAMEMFEATRASAHEAMEKGYRCFEGILATALPEDEISTPTDMAHIIVSAVRGFKQVAASGMELAQLIESLLTMLRL